MNVHKRAQWLWGRVPPRGHHKMARLTFYIIGSLMAINLKDGVKTGGGNQLKGNWFWVVRCATYIFGNAPLTVKPEQETN